MGSLTRRLGMIFPAFVVAGGLNAEANAQTVSGTINSTISLSSACEVNGNSGTSNVDFGTLNFGSHSTFFTSAEAQVDGNGSGSISIQCSPGSDATLTINSGLHDAAISGGGRALSNGTLYIPYDIYSDSGFANVLNNNSNLPVTGDGTVQVVPIYGRAVGTPGLVPGTYNDTISLTLTF